MSKVAIVGVEGSGKTVLMAALGEKYSEVDETEKLCDLSFLDYGGEIYRRTFGEAAEHEADEYPEQVTALREYVVGADVLLVLINISDVIDGSVADQRVQERRWLSKSILDDATRKFKIKNIALVFTQVDAYRDILANEGGVRGVYCKYLRHVANVYPKLPIFDPINAPMWKFEEATSACNAYLADFDPNRERPRECRLASFPMAGKYEQIFMRDLRERWECLRASVVARRRRWVTVAAAGLLGVALAGGDVTPSRVAEGRRVQSVAEALPDAKQGRDVGRCKRCLASGEKVPGLKPENESARTLVRETKRCIQPGETRTLTLPGGARLEMVWCPPGEFVMGSCLHGFDDETPLRRVRMTKGFWLAKHEVTQAQWESVMGNNPSFFKGANRPVEQVTWDDCQAFCRKAGQGLRLPTEAEWEYACRAGTTTAYCWGDALNGDRANCNGNEPCGTTVKGPYRRETTPVGSYESGKNAWGLYDMHGNVGEWCEDWYNAAYSDISPTNDPSGPVWGEWRVCRGGDWKQCASCCCSASRCASDCLDSSLGFRVACSAAPSERGSGTWGAHDGNLPCK